MSKTRPPVPEPAAPEGDAGPENLSRIEQLRRLHARWDESTANWGVEAKLVDFMAKIYCPDAGTLAEMKADTPPKNMLVQLKIMHGLFFCRRDTFHRQDIKRGTVQ